ncbi:hypothetical protein IWQ60_001386 [Tieghemiomyces parasiticus]|uniref:RING-type domain-containing protein n=1 Tax=Tieghemiomyces parasiticus TaxID=78921 RepID=A0A9W8AH59_9FUNG|nr:hypothetical protein IWQ60_001386 [Tieghemiomyces parasiticus]
MFYGMLFVHEDSCSQNETKLQDSNLDRIVNQPKIAVIPYNHNCSFFAAMTHALPPRTVAIITYHEPRTNEHITDGTDWVQTELIKNPAESSKLMSLNLTIPAVAIGTQAGRDMVQRIHRTNGGLDHYSQHQFEMIHPTTFQTRRNDVYKVFLTMSVGKPQSGARLWGLAVLGGVAILLIASVPRLNRTLGHYTWYRRRFLFRTSTHGPTSLEEAVHEAASSRDGQGSKHLRVLLPECLNRFPAYLMTAPDLAKIKQYGSISCDFETDGDLKGDTVTVRAQAPSYQPRSPFKHGAGVVRRLFGRILGVLRLQQRAPAGPSHELSESVRPASGEARSPSHPTHLSRGYSTVSPNSLDLVDEACAVDIADQPAVKKPDHGIADNAATDPDRLGFYLSDCSICLDEFSEGSLVRILPCRHYFHTHCVDVWLTKKSALCPLCKFDCK